MYFSVIWLRFYIMTYIYIYEIDIFLACRFSRSLEDRLYSSVKMYSLVDMYTSYVGNSVICKCIPRYVRCKSRSIRGSTSETCICTATFS